MTHRQWQLIAVSAALSIAASACSSDGDDAGASEPTVAVSGETDDGSTENDTGDTETTISPTTAAPVELGLPCVPGPDDLPMSSALEPGPTSSAYYETVSAFEYADMERTHIHRADFYLGDPDDACVVSSRALEGEHLSSYNIVTRDRGEAFLYGTDPEPYVVKFDLETGEVVWTTELPTIEDNFAWVGLVVTHGNGDVYAVHSRTLVRLDPASGEILSRIDLPPPSGSLASDTVYNGFTVAPNGLIVAKSYGRPAGCTENGTAALFECVDDANPQPPSVLATLDPITLEVLSTVELPEVATGRPAVAEFNGDTVIYLNGADNVYRIRLDGSDLTLDDTWQYGGFLTDGQTGSSSVVVMGDWVAFQTNGTPSQAPMTVHVVSQADSSVSASRDPFTPAPGPSFTPSSVTADPTSMAVYSQDGGRGQIARLDFDEENVELAETWVVDQRTINHLTLIGPPDERVLVSTDAPDAVAGLLGDADYEEQVVWRSADTGEELARSEPLPPPFIGGPVTPGFDGTHFYLGLDGTIRVLSTTGCMDAVCDAPSDASLAPSAESADTPKLLSAYLGALDLDPLRANGLAGISGCDQQPLDEGMPVVLSHRVDGATLEPSDFAVTTAGGAVMTPTCATLEPATDDDELQTVLLTGPLGSTDDPPAEVTVVGDLLALDGTTLTGISTDVTGTFETGPELILARLDPAGDRCSALGSREEIQMTWAGGVTGPRGSEPGPAELAGLTAIDGDGASHELLGFDDLGDGDNYVVACASLDVEPATLQASPGTFYDPTDNPNPSTSVPVNRRD